MSNFFNLLNSFDKKIKFKFFLFFIFIIINSILELINISLIIPIIEFLGQNKITHFNFLNEFLLNNSFDNDNKIINIALLILIIIFIKNIFYIFINYWLIIFTKNLELKISDKVFANYLNKNIFFFINNNSSTLIRNLTTEIQNIIKAINSFFTVLVEIFIVLFLLSYLIFTEFNITIIIFFGISTLSLILFYLFKKKINNWSEKRIILSQEYLKIIIQTFNSIKELFVFERTKDIRLKHLKKKNEYLDINQNFGFTNFLPRPILETIIFSIIIFVIIKFIHLENLFSSLVLYSVVLLRLFPSATKIMMNSQSFLFRLPAFKVIQKDFLDSRYNKSKKLNYLTKNQIKSKFKLENISFKYDQKKVINNLNYQFEIGKIYGIAGKSGSGKSTLLDIIMGLKKPSEGKIKLDEKVLNFEKDAWFNFFGYVPQNVYLYDETIIENIGFGIEKSIIDIKKTNLSIEMASLKNFVDGLPIGLNTIVGEKGEKISGGQIQRIGIARALYNDPKILILDEITSHLDDKTELKIIDELKKIKKDKLIIFVTHNKKILDNFDDTLYLDNND